MKDYRHHAHMSFKYGLSGLIPWVGPIAYFIFRRLGNDFRSDEWGYLMAAFLLSYLFAIYGLILKVLESIKFSLFE